MFRNKEFAVKILYATLFGMIVSFFYIAGAEIENTGSVDLLKTGFYVKWISVTILAGIVVWFVWKLFYSIQSRQDKQVEQQAYKSYPYICYVLILFLCWLPALLSIFPGAFAYDSHEEWMQITTGITAHHPVLHVLLLGGCVEGFYQLTGSYNVGIAIYCILQMLLLAGVFAYTIKFMERYKVCRGIRIFALLFYCVHPVIQMFSISTTKDVLFTAASLLFLLYSIDICVKKEEFFSRKTYQIGFACSAFFTMILRNNGLYVVLIMLAVFFFQNRKYIKRYVLIVMGIFLCYVVYAGPFYKIVDVEPGGIQEMLSVPIQQVARVYQYNYEELPEEELELLYQVLPEKNLKSYRSTVSDFVKQGFVQEAFKENAGEYLKLWLRWGIRYPMTYVNSFLINTSDFWYPNAVINGYQHPYIKSNYFDYQVDVPGTETIVLKGFHEYYRRISEEPSVMKIPGSFLILSPGWYFLQYMCFLFYARCYKVKRITTVLLSIFLVWLTVLLGPMALVRYVLILFYAYPVLIALILQGKRFAENEETDNRQQGSME